MPIYENAEPDIRSMQGIHLYQYFLSNCSQRVCIALEEKGLDWTPHPINLFAQENTRDEYFRINPTGLVPAMVHDGVVITESIDILRYIEEQFPEPALYPPHEAERRKVDEWMNLATENHTGVVKTYMYAVAFDGKSPEVMERYSEKQEDKDLLAFHQESSAGFTQSRVLAAERELFAFYDSLEQQLGGRQWLVGDRFTYADIAWFVQYFLNNRTGVINFQNYPNIRRWGALIMQRPSFRRGVTRIQPWYARLMCLALRIKSRLRRGEPAPMQPRPVAPQAT